VQTFEQLAYCRYKNSIHHVTSGDLAKDEAANSYQLSVGYIDRQ